ncbi:MAG: hypothetical protein RIK85_13735 [Marinobacter sp.]
MLQINSYWRWVMGYCANEQRNASGHTEQGMDLAPVREEGYWAMCVAGLPA